MLRAVPAVTAVDVVALRKLESDMGGDRDVMHELVETFLAEAPRQIATMRAALAAGQAHELNRVAHSMKSTSATFGAMGLSRLCRELEATTMSGIPRDAPGQVAAVEAEWTRTRGELEAWLGKGGG